MDEKKYIQVLEDLTKMKADINDLKERVKNLEEGSVGTGVYLDGCPDYAVDFITSKTSKKEGE